MMDSVRFPRRPHGKHPRGARFRSNLSRGQTENQRAFEEALTLRCIGATEELR